MKIQGDVCLGCARIERPGPSLYTLNIGKCRDKYREKARKNNKDQS